MTIGLIRALLLNYTQGAAFFPTPGWNIHPGCLLCFLPLSYAIFWPADKNSMQASKNCCCTSLTVVQGMCSIDLFSTMKRCKHCNAAKPCGLRIRSVPLNCRLHQWFLQLSDVILFERMLGDWVLANASYDHVAQNSVRMVKGGEGNEKVTLIFAFSSFNCLACYQLPLTSWIFFEKKSVDLLIAEICITVLSRHHLHLIWSHRGLAMAAYMKPILGCDFVLATPLPPKKNKSTGK